MQISTVDLILYCVDRGELSTLKPSKLVNILIEIKVVLKRK